MRATQRFYTVFCLLGVIGLGSAGLPARAAEGDATASPERAAQHEAAVAQMRAQIEADFDSLGLSATQKQDLGTLIQLYGEQLGAILSRGDAARLELLQLSPLDPDYDTVTNVVSQEAAAAAGNLVNTLSELQRTAFLLLSNEQQDTFLQLRATRQAEARAKMAELRARREAAQAQRGGPGLN